MDDDARWAVITGASSGIGRALALEFAAGGFNVVLTGRDRNALDGVAAECARLKAATHVVAADLSEPGGVDPLVGALAAARRRYEVLVNNAGFGIHGDFASSPIDDNLGLVNLQVHAALRLTRTLLPGMIRRGSGRILNVASVYSFAPVPLQSVYAASKAFLLSFSQSLGNELAGTGVTVTCFCPGVTRTAFRSRAGIAEKRPDAGMSAETAARIACTATLRGRPIVVPGVVNRVFVLAARMLPPGLTAPLVRFINRRRGQQSS